MFLSGLSGFLSFLLVGAVGLVVATALIRQKLAAPGPLQADKVVVIAPNTSVSEILAQLDQEGVIDSPLLVNLALLVGGNHSKVKAGEYRFRQNVSARAVMDKLVSGKQVLHSITIPEGLTTDQILARLRASDVLGGTIHENPKEGSLLPETYEVLRGMSRDALIREMEKAQAKAVARIWSRRAPNLLLKSPQDLVTLASIVEKETGKADERPRVAEVFLNRLARHMRLQSDPTVVYGLVGGKGTLGRGITKSEIEQPTPYNTYVINGLPPGPITNPGVAALEAVAHPSHTTDLYFVADGTGGHVFAKTLKEHLKNVARWRQIEKAERAKSPSFGVDHASPSAWPTPAILPRISPFHDQHSQSHTIADPIFGALPSALGLRGIGSLARVVPNPTGQGATAKAAAAGRAASARFPSSVRAFAAFSIGPKLDQDIVFKGVTRKPDGSSLLDGPIESAAHESVQSAVTALPSHRVDQAAGAGAKVYGALRGAVGLPGEAAGAKPAVARNASAAARTASAAKRSASADAEERHAPVYDASEGTPLDPLLNKTWDLNSPKTVPPLPALPAKK